MQQSFSIITELTSLVDKGIHKRNFGSEPTTLVIRNEKIEDILKIVKYLEDCGLMMKDITNTIENKTKE